MQLKLFTNIWQTEKGFSLSEVMIGGAILAGIGLAGATLFRDQKFAQTRVDQNQKLNAYHADLIKFLNDTNNCNATLKTFYNATSVGGAINDLYECNGCTEDTLAQQDASTVTPKASPYLSVGMYIDQANMLTSGTGTDISTRYWKITSMVLSTATKTGKATLKVSYFADRSKNPYTINKDLTLNLRFASTGPSAGRFQECFAGKESSVNNLQNDVCNAFSTISSTGTLTTWDDASQKCKIINTGSAVRNCTTENALVKGVGADGLVHCEQVDTSNLDDSSACSPGSPNARIQMVGGKVQIICN